MVTVRTGTSDVSPQDLPLGPPLLENEPEAAWRRHAQIAYLFARHARHDLMGVQSTLNMLDAVQRASTVSSAGPLPPELQVDQVKAKARSSIRYLGSAAHDLALLGQAANPAAYAPSIVLGVRDLLEDAILSRLQAGGPAPARLIGTTPLGNVAGLGSMLQAAITVFYFQWTPWSHAHEAASHALLRQDDDRVEVEIPADDSEVALSVAGRLQEEPDAALALIIRDAASIRTAELALWLARFAVRIHGGQVAVDTTTSSHPSYRITLPLARPPRLP